jgi:hypothetical protein
MASRPVGGWALCFGPRPGLRAPRAGDVRGGWEGACSGTWPRARASRAGDVRGGWAGDVRGGWDGAEDLRGGRADCWGCFIGGMRGHVATAPGPTPPARARGGRPAGGTTGT